MKLYASALLACTACAPAPGLVYDIHLDTGMLAANQEMAVAALDAWDAATEHRMTLSLEVAPCSGAADEICIRDGGAEDHPGHDAWTDAHPSGLHSITMYQDVDPSYYQQVVEHELGHAFGLSHSACGTVMYQATGDCQAGHVTPGDVAQFWSLRQ